MQANINVIKGRHLIGKQENEENRRTAYQYDSYYRLRRVDYDCAYSSSDPTCANNRNNVFKCNSSETDCEDFQLDGVHNIRASRENQIDVSWTVDGFNRLTQKSDGSNTVKYTYDSNNNMTGEDLDGDQNADIVYTYDKLNRLIEVKDGSQNTIAEYTYDAFNRRITKTVGITTERFSYDDWNIVEISINSDLYTNIIDSSTDRHIAIEVTANNTSTLYYFLTDERGNVTALTDANGNILERYRYRVYGDFEILDAQFTPKNCNNQTCYATNLHNFLWGGSLYEPETNLYWMRNRYYHIDMHRFINQDPIGIWGDANNLGNGFAYVAGMVIEASDPSGLELTSKSSLGKKIIEYGCESSATFAKLARESNDRLIITTNDLTEKYGGAYNDPKNKKIVLSLEIAKNGIEADITDDEDRKKENEKATTKYLSPQAAAAHEMAEAAFKRGNANK